MNELKDILNKKLKDLETIQKSCEKKLRYAPKGSIYAIENKNTYQYYWQREDGTRQYINKSNKDIIPKLVQKEYEKRVWTIIQNNRNCIENMLNKYEFKETMKAYEDISHKKKMFITPYVLSDKEYAVTWQQEQNELKEQNMSKVSEKYILTGGDNAIITEKGEVVRSKSEKIIADKLYMKEIPYVYEQPLYLKGYGYVVPDFKILNVRTKKEYYLEHFGMMDDYEYAKNAIKKIECFQKNEIYPGEKLLITLEASDSPLNMIILEKMVNKYLL